MNLFKLKKLAKAEAQISDVCPITHLNSPSVFETNRGLLGAVLKIEGVPYALEEIDTLNHYQRLLHQALVELDARFMIYAYVHRKKKTINLHGEFTSEFARDLNQHYMARFQNQALYENHLYLCIVLKGDTSTKTTATTQKLKKFINRKNNTSFAMYREAGLKLLNQTVETLIAKLHSFKPFLLSDENLLKFLSLTLNAEDGLAFSTPTHALPIAKDIVEVFQKEIIYPEGNLSQYLSHYQLFFGDVIQFQGNTDADVKYGAMLSLKKYPTETHHFLLDLMLSLDCEFISTSTFAPIERDVALKQISLKRNKLANAEDKALSQIEALVDLEDAIAGENDRLGTHHHTIMLVASNINELEDAILEATKRYAHSNIAVIKENSLGIEPAFWSQIPGNHTFIARASLITAKNFVDFTPFHNMKTKMHDGNHLKSAVTILETSQKTPLYFHYHAEGSKDNPSKGHTAIFGGNNAGKTTLVNFLDSQMGRFKGRSFYIDRDESSKIYILACGNSSYTKIAPDAPISMNPLQLPDSKENRSFLKMWLATLLLKEGESSLPSDVSAIVNDCIDYVFETLDAHYRSLSHLSCYLSVDFPRWSQLNKWIKGNQNRIDGEFAWIFDNEHDSLNFDFDKVGFDVTFLMDKTSHLISQPIYLYLVHRMQLLLDGRLTSFVIDEAWQLFQSPFWNKCLAEWLPTIRKKNGHFIFMTQSANTIITSPIRHVVLDNLATFILFPNHQASKETYIDALNLTETEFETIKDTPTESRVFLYKQGNQAMLAKLDLKGMEDFIRVLSGNTKSVKLLDSLIQQKGANPNDWLLDFMNGSAL